MCYLSRLLPLVIHDLMPKENPDWKLFTDLMKIVDLLFPPVIKKDTTFYVAILIQEYLQEFKLAFPTINLIPKQHFIVHYPGQIRRCSNSIQYFSSPSSNFNTYKKLTQETTVNLLSFIIALQCTVHNVLIHFFDRHEPLVRQWCMWFEAKYRYFKKLAHGMTNF